MYFFSTPPGARRSTTPLLLCLALPLLAAKCDPASEKDPVKDTSDDDTAVDDTGDTPEPFWEISSLHGIANVDDDDLNGVADFEDATLADDDDLSALAVPEGLGTLLLGLEGEGLRVWLDGAILLDSKHLTAELDTSVARELRVEFSDHLQSGRLSVQTIDASSSSEIALLSAPLVLNHHLQAATHLWVITMDWMGYSNAAMVAQLQEILGAERVTAVPGSSYEWDVWVQDEMEFARRRDETHEGQVVVDSIRSSRNRYLDAFPEDYLQEPGVAVQTWGSGMANSLDSFGNLETSPPVTVDGVSYPLGRTYMGGSSSYHPSNALTGFLSSQQVQSPVMLDSTWLCVGHVDEFFTFVPDPSSDKGFRLLVTDVDVAWELLDSLDPETEIPKYRTAHRYSTIGALVGDTALRDMNQDIQRDNIEPVIEQLQLDFGLDESDIIRVPGIWEENSLCRGYALALIPGLINLAVFTETDGTTKLLIADPFLRANGVSQDEDPFIDLWDSLMPASAETWYVDDWSVYHEGWGEVHCGTNIHRDPGSDWWTSATHLLGGTE